MRNHVLAALLLFAGAKPVIADDVAGHYQVRGIEIGGKSYEGTVEISMTSSSTCRIVWRIGRSIYRGICMRKENVFSATYTSGKVTGLVIYEVNADRTISGLWTVADREGIGSEVLTPMR